MPNEYDRQLVLQLLTGVDDKIIEDGTTHLRGKAKIAKEDAITIRLNAKVGPEVLKDLVDRLGKLTAKSRLYIRGHGDWINQRVGSCSAEGLADLIGRFLPKTLLISVAACQAGRDKGSGEAHRVVMSADSFASKFHKLLKEKGCKARLYARVYVVRVRPSGTKGTGTSNSHEAVTHRKRSKNLFDWNGDDQIRRWVDYDNRSHPENWEDVDQYAVEHFLV